MNSRPRVDIFVPSLQVGGTERQILYLLEGLHAAFDVRLVCTREAGAWAERAKSFAPVDVLGLQSGWDPRLFLRSLARLRADPPDIVQTFLFGFDAAVNFAARSARVPMVVSGRRERATWKKPRHIALQRFANRFVDAIVANSNAVADYAAEQEGRAAKDYTVVYNCVAPEPTPNPPVDARVDMTVPRSAPLIGMVANFSRDKDHELFVAMAEHLRSKRPDAHFVLIGDGPERPAIQRLVVHRGMADVFRFLGQRESLRPYYEAMDVVVLCSRTEGLPNVVLEARVYGRPIVAAAVGGIPEVIADRVTGVLVPSRSPDEFAVAVLDLLNRPDEAARIGRQAAIYTGDRFTPEAMVRGYSALYQRLLTEKRGAS